MKMWWARFLAAQTTTTAQRLPGTCETLEFGMGARGERPKNKITGPVQETWNCEGFLAHARLILAFVCIVIVYFNAAGLGRHVRSGRLLILVYLTYSLLNLALVQLQWRRSRVRELGLRASELLIISLITMRTGGAQSPFLGLYLIVVLAAACGWGSNGTFLTFGACIVLLFSDLILPSSWSGSAEQYVGVGGSFATVLTLSACLASFAFLLGLLVERERKRYQDAEVIVRLVRGIAPGPSFGATLRKTLI